MHSKSIPMHIGRLRDSHMTFFGTQPTLTHVPPSLPFSTTPTLAPYDAARRADAIPPEPAPMTSRSKSYPSSSWEGVAAVALRRSNALHRRVDERRVRGRGVIATAAAMTALPSPHSAVAAVRSREGRGSISEPRGNGRVERRRRR